MESCVFAGFLKQVIRLPVVSILENSNMRKELRKGKKEESDTKNKKKSNVLVLLLDEVQQIQI